MVIPPKLLSKVMVLGPAVALESMIACRKEPAPELAVLVTVKVAALKQPQPVRQHAKIDEERKVTPLPIHHFFTKE
jgi:hypothetical protein